MIHIDVWDPFSVITHEGYRYFFTIVDDHSRATWVFLLKSKSDVLTVFPEFVTLVENQYKKRIKSVRADNAPELFLSIFIKAKVSYLTIFAQKHLNKIL